MCALQVMAFRPLTWSCVHAHPNIEFVHTLAGTMHKIRLKSCIDIFTTTGDGALRGPDLGALRVEDVGSCFVRSHTGKGECLANTLGSVRQTFTWEGRALIVTLWSVCHAHFGPEQCGGHRHVLCPASGWASSDGYASAEEGAMHDVQDACCFRAVGELARVVCMRTSVLCVGGVCAACRACVIPLGCTFVSHL